MPEYLIVLLVGLIALFGGDWWAILVGALGLSISPWHAIWLMMKRYPHLRRNWGAVVYLGRAFCISLAACAAAYLIGATMRVAP